MKATWMCLLFVMCSSGTEAHSEEQLIGLQLDSVVDREFIVHSIILRTRCLHLSQEALKYTDKGDIVDFSKQMANQIHGSQSQFLAVAKLVKFSLPEDLYGTAIAGLALEKSNPKSLRSNIINNYRELIELILRHYMFTLVRTDNVAIKEFVRQEIIALSNLKDACVKLKN